MIFKFMPYGYGRRMFCMMSLKILTNYFEDIISNYKRFEIRKNDRNFSVGEYIKLEEWNILGHFYTGRYVIVEITYILKDCPEYGLSTDYCIFGFVIKHITI